MPNLLTPMASNPKTAKLLAEHGVEGVILHLLADSQAHEALGMRGTLCPMAKRNGCAVACLVNQGRGRLPGVYAGRLRRTRLYLTDRPAFMAQLRRELALLLRITPRFVGLLGALVDRPLRDGDSRTGIGEDHEIGRAHV